MKDYLSLAAKKAWQGAKKKAGGPFGAVIVKGNRILATAHNEVLKNNDPTCHAEINAIRIAARKMKSPFLAGCTIYSTTEPCPMCFAAIHWARIRKVIYATTIADVNRLGFNELLISNKKLKRWGRSRVQIQRIPHRASALLLQRWASLPTKKTY